MTELSFQLPEASIAVKATEAQRVSEELGHLGTQPTGQDYARMARRIGTAAREPSLHAVELLDVADWRVNHTGVSRQLAYARRR